jgi:lathosterol oxidase
VEHFEKFESYIPVDLTNPWSFFVATGLIFAVVVFRYFLVVGSFWIVFYRLKPTALLRRQIYSALPSARLQKFEIKWSLVTSFVFALSGALIGLFWQLGWTKIYLKFDLYGWWYLLVSLILISLVHDFYFYWSHRWMHRPSVFKKIHALHHESLTPSPWASFSFHPIEGIIQAIALPLIILIIPVHPVALIFYLTLMTFSAISNHLGFELLPQGSEKGVAKWVISGVHHTMHHRSYRTNFGLFYTFCDHLFRTEHINFQQDYRKVFEMKTL